MERSSGGLQLDYLNAWDNSKNQKSGAGEATTNIDAAGPQWNVDRIVKKNGRRSDLVGWILHIPQPQPQQNL